MVSQNQGHHHQKLGQNDGDVPKNGTPQAQEVPERKVFIPAFGQICIDAEAFLADAEKNVAGNKAAGARARKVSLELEKLMKEFRKVSVAAK